MSNLLPLTLEEPINYPECDEQGQAIFDGDILSFIPKANPNLGHDDKVVFYVYVHLDENLSFKSNKKNFSKIKHPYFQRTRTNSTETFIDSVISLEKKANLVFSGNIENVQLTLSFRDESLNQTQLRHDFPDGTTVIRHFTR